MVMQFFYNEGGEQGYKVMLEKLLPLAASLLEDEKQEVDFSNRLF